MRSKFSRKVGWRLLERAAGAAFALLFFFPMVTAEAESLADTAHTMEGYMRDSFDGHGPDMRRTNESDTTPDLQLRRYREELDILFSLHDLEEAESGEVPQPSIDHLEYLTLPVGNVQVESARMKAGYLKSFLDLREGEVPDIPAFQRAFTRFHASHSAVLQIAITAGADGRADYVVRCIEPRPVTVGATVENFGTESVGLYQTGYAVKFNGITGHSDDLRMSGLFASGTKSGLIDYKTPVGRAGDTLVLGYSATSLEHKDGVFEPFHVKGHGQSAYLTYDHLLSASESGKSSVSFSYNYYKSKLSADFPASVRDLFSLGSLARPLSGDPADVDA